jgi:hypothetical protein
MAKYADFRTNYQRGLSELGEGPVQCRERVGGVLEFYSRTAA